MGKQWLEIIQPGGERLRCEQNGSAKVWAEMVHQWVKKA